MEIPEDLRRIFVGVKDDLHFAVPQEHRSTPLGLALSLSAFLAALAQHTRKLRFGPLVRAAGRAPQQKAVTYVRVGSFSTEATAPGKGVDVGCWPDCEVLPALPRTVKDYIHGFGITAICVYRDGRIGTSRDPAGAVAAWWVEAELAGGLIKQAQKNGGDIPAIARKLGVTLTEHDVVIVRAQAAAARIESAIAQAMDRGDLKFFNAEYRRRRAEAKRRGQGFMSYSAARERLGRAIASAAAGTMTAGLLDSVFK
jgi:hypothetical protein